MKKFIFILMFLLFSFSQIYSQWTPSTSDTARWTSSTLDGAVKLKVKDGYIYVTGYAQNNATDWAIMTIKYNSNCVKQWKAIYAPSSFISVSGIDVSDSGMYML